jgi:hypothetical protein
MSKAAYAPHRVDHCQFKALKKDIIVTDMVFDQRISRGGIILPNDNGSSLGIRPRWGRVYAIGKDQKDVQVGQWICVAHGRWTRGIDIEDGQTEHKRTIRKIDPKDILLVSNDQPSDDTMSEAVQVTAQSR